MFKKFLGVTFIFLTLAFALQATEEQKTKEVEEITGDGQVGDKPQKTDDKLEAFKEQTVETLHTYKSSGVDISYKATAGTMLLKDEEDKIKGRIFYIAYTKEGERSPNRPITFCFNGGPGSSSVWLHMGVLGPKRVSLDETGYPILPYRLLENNYSILDTTDLVFIDPISTGYSKAAPGEDPKQFHGVDEDIHSVAQFIRLYATRYSRWESPKFLAGESYGTTRAAGLAGYLHDELCMYFDGVILISSVLNFQTIDFNESNDLPYILFLPTYAATAMYHNKLAPELQSDFQKTLSEVKEFATKEYAQALMEGDLLPPETREKIAQKLARYTGLPEAFIRENNLRVTIFRFVKQLLRDQKRVVGRFDSRFRGIDNDVASEKSEFDPSLELICGAFTSTFNQYIRNDLKWERDDQYKILATVWPWNYGKATNQYLYVGDTLRDVMSKNPNLRVFVASGYYDLATPFAATDYTFHHLKLDPSLHNNITMEYYDAGHMMYVHKPSLVKLHGDLTEFIKDTLAREKVQK